MSAAFLIIQNAGEVSVSGNARLWTTAGGATPVTTVAFTLGTRQATVISLATVAAYRAWVAERETPATAGAAL